MRRLAIILALLPCLAAQAAWADELVMFERSGCSWCERWHREVGQAYPNSSESAQAPLRVVSLDRARPGDLKNLGPIRFTPTFVVIACGQEKGRITGYPGAMHFWGLLDSLLERPAAC
ncbi:MAG: hypothetical protein HZC25_04675 [Rhodospirillales bacterium]|nr:hypothetical protein [Rhodospirillales bacterium]